MTKKVKIKSNKKWLYKWLYSHDFYHRQFSRHGWSLVQEEKKNSMKISSKKTTKKQVYGLTAGLIQVRETENYCLSAFWFVSVEAQISDLCSLWNLIFLVMTDVTDMQFNLHNQGPPAWRLSIAGSLWLLDSTHGVTLKRRIGGYGCICIILAFCDNSAVRAALLIVKLGSCKDSEGWKWLPLKSHRFKISHRLPSSVCSEDCAVLGPQGKEAMKRLSLCCTDFKIPVDRYFLPAIPRSRMII